MARDKPGSLSYASGGNGGIGHYSGELLKSNGGKLDIVHVPYKSAAEQVTSVMTGQTQLAFPALQIALPLLRPAVVTVLLLSVVGTWNNYFLPLAMLSDSKLFPITVGIGLWQGQAMSNNSGGENLWGLIITGSLVSIIPLVVAFLSLQKYWQGGLSVGALK